MAVRTELHILHDDAGSTVVHSRMDVTGSETSTSSSVVSGTSEMVLAGAGGSKILELSAILGTLYAFGWSSDQNVQIGAGAAGTIGGKIGVLIGDAGKCYPSVVAVPDITVTNNSASTATIRLWWVGLMT